MSGPVFAGAVAGLVVGVLLTLGLVLAWRLARGSRELGSDSDRATFRTLHLASRAAPALAVLAGGLVHTIDSTITETTAPMYTLAVIVGVGIAPLLRPATSRHGTADAV